MPKLAKYAVTLCVVFGAIAISYAGKDSKENQVSEATSKKCDAACSECKPCAVSKAMEALPKLVYRIGEETTTSPVEAGRIARKTKHKIEFVVQEKVFKEETVAFAAMVDMTEKFVADFAKPRKCNVSGNTIVAGKSVCCEVAAGEVVSLVKKAMDTIKVSYRVGEETTCCPDAAKALAEKSGEKVVKVVAGKACGGCSTTTRLNLARAKYKAAVEALLASDKDAGEGKTSQSETADDVSAT